MATIERKRMSSINAESRSNIKGNKQGQQRGQSCKIKLKGSTDNKYQTVVV
jgi:hypothetical protein